MSDIIVLDLGTSRAKVGRFSQNTLLDIHALPSPPISGDQGRRVSDPISWLKVAETLLSHFPEETPLALASQRSSFLLWNRHNGNPATPLISWQDLRAGDWVHYNRHLESWSSTGLPLSPHYAGPKLAMLLEDRQLASQAGDLLFGTLDSWLIWNWTEGQHHITGMSIAARTLLVDLDSSQWSLKSLQDFRIPPSLMPEIVDDLGPGIPTKRGYSVKTILADQAAGAMPLFQSYPQSAYVSTGTGTFVMRCGDRQIPPGYQIARVGDTPLNNNTLIWEGAINGGVSLFLGPAINFFQTRDPNQFAVGDTAGLGAPFWRDDLSGYCTSEVDAMQEGKRREIFAEGLVFRIRQVIEGLFEDQLPEQVLLAGGLAGRADFTEALATLLPMPLYIVQNKEMGLWGAGWQASAHEAPPEIPLILAPKSRGGAAFRQRYERWNRWLHRVCEDRRSQDKHYNEQNRR